MTACRAALIASAVINMIRASQVVAFAGSRRLRACSAVCRAARAVLSSGRFVGVGCSSGADAAVIRQALALGRARQLVVFAVGGPDGRGFWSGSCFGLVRLAARRGARVVWWAGGPCRCAGRCACLRQRLRARTLRLVSAASALVAFPLGGPRLSPGTWLAVRCALSLGLPVRLFLRGFKREWLPRRHGRYEVEWRVERWTIFGWKPVSGVWAQSLGAKLWPADEAKSELREEAHWFWEVLQFNSLKPEEELNLESDEPLPEEPGEETEFELVDGDEDDELSSTAVHKQGYRWWIPAWVHQVEREVFGRPVS